MKKFPKIYSALFLLSLILVGLISSPAHVVKADSMVPLYRYYNGTDHFYTTNWNELGSGKNGYAFEGIACHVWDSNTTGGYQLPFFRFYNGTDHIYTTNWNELNGGPYHLTPLFGYSFESIACYVDNTNRWGGEYPLYRYFNGTDHFYTTNWNELGSGRYGYHYEAIACYVEK